MEKTGILVEGWRFIPHSFAIVNQFQCLELGGRPDIELYHRDTPYWGPNWAARGGLLPARYEQRLATISAPPEDQIAEITLRMNCPFDFSDSRSRQTIVFATCEFGRLTPEAVRGGTEPGSIMSRSDACVITPSHWSKAGLVRSGIEADRIYIVPHGADQAIFHPISMEQRTRLRKQFGWHDSFVFLNIGAVRPNKGIPQILHALSQLVDRYPNVLLVLKGLNSLYQSDRALAGLMANLPPPIREKVASHVRFAGTDYSLAQVATLYQAADAYVSPYTGEGFNLPVLEAMSCGLPVICTANGSTDDFITSSCARRIDATETVWIGENAVEYRVLNPSLDHLAALMSDAIEDSDWRDVAMVKGPAHVAQQFTWRSSVDKLMWLFTTGKLPDN